MKIKSIHSTDVMPIRCFEALELSDVVVLGGPSDCIVIFDEPELHLHPELSYKLIQTLRSVGKRNPVYIFDAFCRYHLGVIGKFSHLCFTS